MLKLKQILTAAFVLSLLLCHVGCTYGQSICPNDKIVEYINAYKEAAIEQMVLYRIPASVTLAQAIKESNYGSSYLAINSNNHFGIKCHKEWGGDSFNKDDDTLNECFRKYKSVADSYLDHSLFLKSRPRYAFLFSLDIRNYKAWCFGLKEAGYATSPPYAFDLIQIIETYELYKIDQTPYLPMISQVNELLASIEKNIIPKKTEDISATLYGGELVKTIWGDKSWREETIFVRAGSKTKPE